MRWKILTGLVLSGACAGPGAQQGQSQAVSSIVREFSIEPGKFAELNMNMTAGAEAVADFEVKGGKVAWDIHSHPNQDQVVIHDKGTAGQGQIAFRCPGKGLYSFLWKNEGVDVVTLRVSVSLQGDVQIHSWHPKR